MAKVTDFPRQPPPDSHAERLKPPRDLTREEKREFSRIVAVYPPDWFTPGSTVLLCAYARHVVSARQVAAAIEAARREGRFEVLEKLLKAQARESRLICQLMTALRLTPRAVKPRSVSIRKLAQVLSPWEPAK